MLLVLAKKVYIRFFQKISWKSCTLNSKLQVTLATNV